MTRDSIRRIYGAALLACGASGGCDAVTAAGLDVLVLDQDGQPVPDVAIYAESLSSEKPGPAARWEPTGAGAIVVMDQVDSAFVPHILVVRAGTAVRFPNSDTVSHHVYSFSDAKPFALDLYRGSPYPPEVFDRPGLIVLGCNIHDGMLGFILVVDTPYFGKTAADGAVRLTGLPDGRYRVSAWTPRTGERNLPRAREYTIDADDTRVVFEFSTKLQPAHVAASGSLEWKRY